MTRRLLFSYLGLAVLILAVLEVPLTILAGRFERDLATSQTERDADGLVAVVTDRLDEGRGLGLDPVVSAYQARTGGEVYVLAPTGRIVASSSKDPDNDADSEWMRLTVRALAGEATSSYTSDEGRPYAVAAVPVADEGHLVGAVILETPARSTENRIHEIWVAIAAFAVAALLVALVVGLTLARSLAKPVAHLESAVNRLGDGELSSRASEESGPPEIRLLAHQFNQMADRINDLVDAQRRFVADASHQLRTPLTALRLRIDNLMADAGEWAAEGLTAVTAELERLSRIVDGILALSRADQETASREGLAISAVVIDRAEAWEAFSSEHDVRLDIRIDPRSETTFADLAPGDLDQILDNLLSNAFEVAPAGSRILVTLGPAGDGRVAIHVIDEGPGMTDDERDRAFDRFWQGSNGAGRSGLGLAIVSQLAHRNNMTVELKQARPSGLDAVVGIEISARHVRSLK